MIASAGTTRRWLIAILVLSCVLRIALVRSGGQYAFSDEDRYDRSLRLYEAIRAGEWAAIRPLAVPVEHAGFQWVGVIIAAGHHLGAQATPYGNWHHHPEHALFTVWMGAALLSLFSTLNLYLVYRLARVSGAGEEESLWVLLLMATANTAFYHARHLAPYDAAVTAVLAALVVGLQRPTIVRSIACGALAGFAYHLYNGYWFTVPAVGLTYLFAQRRQPAPARRLAGLTVGGLVGLGGPLLLGGALGGAEYWATTAAFSRTVTQGVFAEGWSLPWEYLWHSEGPAGAAIAIAIVGVSIWQWQAGRGIPSRLALWICILGVLYGLLVMGSNVLARFVVYGRTVKPLVPFLCLLGGWALAELLTRVPRLKLPAVAAAMFAGLLHFQPHFTLTFPRDFEIAVLRQWGNPKRTLSFAGCVYIPLGQPVTRPDLALANAQTLYPIARYIGYPAGQTIVRAAHPLSYLPYQYEGHTPRERALLRESDFSMRLIKLARPAESPDDLPVALRFTNENRARGF